MAIPVFPPAADETAGYFGPESISWRLYREPAILLGGPRALLLQLAHPAVAVGVERYSNFRADALGRGMRTFVAMALIYFGTAEQARNTSSRLWRIHTAIRGEFRRPGGGTEQSFHANQPDLLAWVLATLTDTTLQVYERVPLRGLPADWRERFYEESRLAAQLLGIPSEHYPPNLPAFRRYFDEMLNSDLLGSAPACRETAQAVVQHRLAPGRLVSLLAAGWMPQALGDRLGLTSKNSHKRLERLLNIVARLYRLIPAKLRYAPAYYQAMARIARARNQPVPFLGKLHEFLASRFATPLSLQTAHDRKTP